MNSESRSKLNNIYKVAERTEVTDKSVNNDALMVGADHSKTVLKHPIVIPDYTKSVILPFGQTSYIPKAMIPPLKTAESLHEMLPDIHRGSAAVIHSQSQVDKKKK